MIVSIALAGCAATAVDRAKDVSAAGLAYTQAAAALVDVAIDAEIDADSEAHVQTNSRALPVKSAEEKLARDVERAKLLKASDSAIIDNVALWKKLQGNIQTLEAYFVALQALANGSQAEATKTAVESLAGRLKSLNATLGGDKPLVTDAQKSALGGLAGLVAKQVHNNAVAHAMQRDADDIDEALRIQARVIEQAENVISGKLKDANARFYVEKVQAPFQAPPLQSGWVSDRRAYIKVAAIGQALESLKTTKAAAKQMQAVWKKVLSGENTVADLNAMLKDTHELIAAAVALKKAERPTKPVTP